jgi:hypothetical protein
MAPRMMVPVHPATLLAKARDAARAAAAEKAAKSPHLLTVDDLDLIPGRMVLDLGNAGHLRHLGIGLPPKHAPAILPSASGPSGSAPAGLDDDALRQMTGEQISKAMSAGLVPGIGPRRRGRRHP